MNAVVETREPVVLLPAQNPVQAQAPDVQSIISAIERAATNPRINLDKMDRLMAMQERILGQFREAQFNAAMAAAQAEMGRIPTNKFNEHTKSHYADYAAIDRLTRPIYTKHGFGLSFDEGETSKAECVRVLCLVTHIGGHSRMYHRDMPADGKGAKGGDVMTKTHAVGSAFSYGQRYLVKGIWNLAIGVDPAEADDDGNAAGGVVPEDDAARVKAGYVSRQEIADLRTLMAQLKTDEPAFLNWMHVKQLADIPKIQLKTAIAALRSSAKARAQAPRSTGGNGRCTEKQITMLRTKLDASGIPENEFFRRFSIDAIDELAFANVDAALQWISKTVAG